MDLRGHCIACRPIYCLPTAPVCPYGPLHLEPAGWSWTTARTNLLEHMRDVMKWTWFNWLTQGGFTVSRVDSKSQSRIERPLSILNVAWPPSFCFSIYICMVEQGYNLRSNGETYFLKVSREDGTTLQNCTRPPQHKYCQVCTLFWQGLTAYLHFSLPEMQTIRKLFQCACAQSAEAKYYIILLDGVMYMPRQRVDLAFSKMFGQMLCSPATWIFTSKSVAICQGE